AAKAARVGVAGVEGDEAVGAFLDGLAQGAYRFQRFLSEPKPAYATAVQVVGAEAAVVERAGHIAERVASARDLVNTPSNHLTPTQLSDHARALAHRYPTLTCEVFGREELEAMGAGAFLAVAQGSAEPPAMIVLRHRPAETTSDEVLGIVGKAVTFDTGGISIKPAAGMEEMKMDMGGGAAALEGTALIAALGLPTEVLCVVPATENMPSGTAIKPGDVVTAMNGTTIEITNTDAEGRLILADALTWAARNGATRLVDLATLTGAVLVALGETYAGLMGSDEEWIQAVKDAGEQTGDLCWPLPMHRDFEALIESKVADILNTASKRLAGTIYAAHFLKRFTDDLPWCHLDVAGTAMPAAGPTGYGVRLLAELAAR
ncbi:MAG: leucyl aminopeptidase, partial [Miltoncostaeaceae bacterium]